MFFTLKQETIEVIFDIESRSSRAAELLHSTNKSSIEDLARLKRACKDFLELPLIQALNEEDL